MMLASTLLCLQTRWASRIMATTQAHRCLSNMDDGGNNNKHIRVVVFDMAGTTVEDRDYVNLCFQNALSTVLSNVTHDEVNSVMGMRKPDAIRIILERRLRLDESSSSSSLSSSSSSSSSSVVDLEAEIDRLHTVFVKTMMKFYAEDERVREIGGAREVFRKLRGGGVKVYLGSGFSRQIMDTIIARLEWAGEIDGSVAADEIARGRPAPDGIRAIMKLAGVADPALVCKCGDTPVDLFEGDASRCGINVGVLSGASTRVMLEECPHTHILNSVAELPPLILP